MLPRIVLTLLTLGLSGSIGAQEVKPSFEVASIRPTSPGPLRTRLLGQVLPFRGDTFRLEAVTLDNMIRMAYGIGPVSPRPFAVIRGLPEWSHTEFSRIEAKTAEPLPFTPSNELGALNLMMQSLLEERFRLRTRWETTEGPAYVLVRARPDEQLGPQVRQSTVDCDAHLAEVRAAGSIERPVLGEALRRPVCGILSGPSSDGRTREVLIGTRPLSALLPELAKHVERPVFDGTGLTGNFDIELRFSLERTGVASPDSDPSLALPVPVAPEPSPWPPLRDALREQLGLQLEPGRGPVDVLVIDSVQRPTEN